MFTVHVYITIHTGVGMFTVHVYITIHTGVGMFTVHVYITIHTGVGMFTYTELSEIVLLVVRKFSIPGFYSARLDCPLQTTGEGC